MLVVSFPTNICSTSVSCDSNTTSYPVIPMSTFPSPTYVAISDAGRNTIVIGKDVQFATSSRDGLDKSTD